MSKVGADLPQLDDLKRTLDTNASHTQDILRSIDGKLASTHWEGPAAQRFRDAWNGEFKGALNKLNEALLEASAEVQRRRQAIEAATH